MEGDDARYAKNAGAVFSLKYHVVWCPKYRKPVLIGLVEKRLIELIREAATLRGMKVHALEVMPDHVHLFLETDPRWAPAEFVGKIKANTSRVLREEFQHLRTRLPTLWSRSYFCATVGAVSETTVRRYIEAQKGRGR
jgi:putative transposase